jgi:hypothetical protein
MRTEKPDALKLTPQEKAAFKQLFSQADQGDNGVITGEVAVKFLEKTNVPQDILGQVRGEQTSPLIRLDYEHLR